MRWILGLFGALVFVGGFIEFIGATTILQQIFAVILFCWSGVLFVGAAILEGLRSNEKVLEDILAKGNKPRPSTAIKAICEAEQIVFGPNMTVDSLRHSRVTVAENF